MPATTEKRRYRPTESQYKGAADEMYITYDREQRTRSGKHALYPKVKRIYIAGSVKDWKNCRISISTLCRTYGRSSILAPRAAG
jgi:hypothetical protein